MTRLDEHGQPNIFLNAQRRTDRAIHELLGLARGMIADGELNDREARELKTWSERNRDLCTAFPGADLYSRLTTIYADGRVDDAERADLQAFLACLTGEPEMSDDPAAGGTTTLPIDAPPPVVLHEGSQFVVTGRFLCGCRQFVVDRLESRGAIVQKAITRQTDYLLLGSMASRDWKHSSFGRKIQKAVEYREQGILIAIVAEDHWASQLRP